MRLEEQVCSLELSKKLKELGVRQESLFYWFEYDWGSNPNSWPSSKKPDNEWRISFGSGPGRYENGVNLDRNNISTFTVAELGEMLPNVVLGDYGADFYRPWSLKNGDGYSCSLNCVGANHWSTIHPNFTADTEANARAKMLIYLVEQGIVKP